MAVHNEHPCSACSKGLCEDRECQLWQNWFLHKWDIARKQIQSCVWNKIDLQGKKAFCYLLPHELEDPCATCVCKNWCDTPCSLRLNWWDNRMAQIRRTLSAQTDRK